MPDVDMAAFWDRRAREHAAYFVESRLPYAEPADLDALWADGEAIVAAYEARLGVAIGPDDDVVEIGCGIGRLTRALAARARSVRATDVSAEMLGRARALHPELDVEWQLGDGRSLAGVADASADAVVSHVVFQHLPDPALTYGYVAEMGRVLRPGGWAAFQVSTDPAVHRPRGGPARLARRLLAATGRAPAGTAHPAWLGSAVDLDALRAAAAGAGLAVSRVTDPGTQYCLVLLRQGPGPGP